MGNWRDIKKIARGKVHGTFAIPAIYLTHITGTPVRANVRVHTKIATNENDFTWPGTSGYVEMQPRIVFDALEVPDVLGKALVIVSATEMYRVDLAEPNREGFIATQCVGLSPLECQSVVADLGPVSGPEWEGVLP